MTLVTPAASGDSVAEDERQWWREAVVYQIYPRSFADSNGDGIGDLNGIYSKLDHLQRLGVDVVWISPVYPSPQDDNGYDIADYQDVDPMFGTLSDLDALVADLHGRGMRLIMDLVVNHTSDEHPWFQESRSSRSNPKRDWYWWRPPRPGHAPGSPGAEPTNWGSFFSGPAWEYDETTGEYYLHLFSRKMPDLNWENTEVRQAVYTMMRWWLDRGVDGFRMDVINLISKDPHLPDGAVPAGAVFGDGGPSYTNGPRIHEFMAEMHEQVFAGRGCHVMTVGEMPGVTPDHARLFTDPVRRELDMVFQFEHVGLDHGDHKFDVRPLDLRGLKASLTRWQLALADTGWNSLYWNNHDQPRVVSRFGNDDRFRVESAKLLATVLHLHRGTPFIYQGEELAMRNAPFEGIDQMRDIEALNHYAAATASGVSEDEVLNGLRRMGRDNARTPMQWTAGPHAGFTTGNPWLAVNPDHVTVNAEAQVDYGPSVFNHFRALIALRRAEPAIVYGTFELLAPDDPQLYAFKRRLADCELLVLANFSDTPLTTPSAAITDAQHGFELLLGNYPPTHVESSLQPWEARVLRRRSRGLPG
jgi:oligo-1,6-glucosidase